MSVKVGDIIKVLVDDANCAKVKKGDRLPVARLAYGGVFTDPGGWWLAAENFSVVTPSRIGPPLTPEEGAGEPLADWGRDLLDPFDTKVRRLFGEAADLLLSKHRDYGPLNIALSPGGPLNGLRVRLHDKLARLNHLVDSGADPQHESLEDTFRDLVGYGAIGLLVMRGDWPDE